MTVAALAPVATSTAVAHLEPTTLATMHCLRL